MHNLKPKKYLGQHFLKDQHVAARIISQLSAPSGADVVEIGPGEGVLTSMLLEKYPHLKVVEVDNDAVAALKNRFEKQKLTIIHQDVLKWKPSGDLKKDAFFIGNLPYNISSPFFFMLLENLSYTKEGVFMIQKEVAERICANHGSKTFGILSVLIGAYFDREYLFSVPPTVFRPPPKVMSGVMKITRKATPPDIEFSQLKRLVKAAFGQRRKTLRNALKSVPLKEFEGKEQILKQRAEQLSVEEFVSLTQYIKEE